jgi:hypothetical protein
MPKPITCCVTLLFLTDVIEHIHLILVFKSQSRPEFDHSPVHVTFVVDKVALGQLFLQVLWFYSVGIIPSVPQTQLHVHISLTTRTNELSLGTFMKSMPFLKQRIWKYFHSTPGVKDGQCRRCSNATVTVSRETVMLDKPRCNPVQLSANFKSIFHTKQTCK